MVINVQIMLRHAQSDFDCLMIAQGMENAGATVISVSPCYPKTEMMKFMVIARYNGDEVDINEIDEGISKMLYGDK